MKYTEATQLLGMLIPQEDVRKSQPDGFRKSKFMFSSAKKQPLAIKYQDAAEEVDDFNERQPMEETMIAKGEVALGTEAALPDTIHNDDEGEEESK